MALAKLSIDLEARLGRLEQDMGRATKLMEQSAGKMQSAFSAAGAGIKSALAGFSVAAAVVGLKSLFDATVLGIDKLNDIADATGASVENISALEDVAARTGTSIDTVSTALVKFNAQISEAQKDGSEAARVFEALGLNAKELARLDPAEALVKTAQALARFADDGEKARYIYALFGKSTREVAPLLKDLAEAGKLNATVTAEQAREAEKFAHHLSQSKKNIEDLTRSIANQALPTLNNLSDTMRSLTSKSAEASETFGGAMRKILLSMQPLLSAILLTRAATKDIGAVSDRNENYGNEGRRERRSLPPLPNKPASSGAAKVSEAERYLDALQRQVESSLELTAVERVLYDLNNGRLTLSNGITKEQLLLAAEVIDSLKEEAKWQEAVNKAAREATDNRNKEYQAAIDAANANMQADRDRLRGILARTPSGQDEQRQRDVQFLQRMMEQERISVEQYAEAITEIFDLGDKGLKQTKTLAEELGMTFASAFENAVVGGKGLRDIIKGIDADITRLLLRKLVTEPAAEWITGAIKGMGGGGGASGMLGGIGSWFSSMFSGWFADGGYIAPGKWGMAGERGPEPVFGGRTGATVRPYSGAVTINISVPGNTDGRTAQQVAVAAARAVATAQRRGA